jgi:hypothetical protein
VLMNSCWLLSGDISCALIIKWGCGIVWAVTLLGVCWKVLYLNLTQCFVHPCVIGTNGVNLFYILICAVTWKDSPPPQKKKKKKLPSAHKLAVQ